MKKPSISKLRKKLDTVFSLWIRTRDNGICYTCGIRKPIKESQNGHYVSRIWTNLRYNEKNCHAQCCGCNVFRNGNLDEYALRLKAQYGEGILEELNGLKHQIKRFTIGELQELINKYTLHN